MASYFSSNIKCPFYLSDDPGTRAITCEGQPAGGTVKFRFACGEAWRGHLMRRCAEDYRQCPWYDALMRWKYPD